MLDDMDGAEEAFHLSRYVDQRLVNPYRPLYSTVASCEASRTVRTNILTLTAALSAHW
jgi:hypothetical protein